MLGTLRAHQCLQLEQLAVRSHHLLKPGAYSKRIWLDHSLSLSNYQGSVLHLRLGNVSLVNQLTSIVVMIRADHPSSSKLLSAIRKCDPTTEITNQIDPRGSDPPAAELFASSKFHTSRMSAHAGWSGFCASG